MRQGCASEWQPCHGHVSVVLTPPGWARKSPSTAADHTDRPGRWKAGLAEGGESRYIRCPADLADDPITS